MVGDSRKWSKRMQLVRKFWFRLGIAVGKMDGNDQHAIGGCLDVAGVAIFSVARQVSACRYRSAVLRENGDSIPGLRGWRYHAFDRQNFSEGQLHSKAS
jgi:hypothetical protein